MHIGIDATYRLHGGGRLHILQLLKAWVAAGTSKLHRITVLTREDNLTAVRDAVDDSVEIVSVLPKNASTLRRLYWQQLVLPKLAVRLCLDVLFCPGNLAPLAPGSVPAVVMLQNAAPFRDSITRRSEGLHQWLSFAVLGWGMKRSVRSATRVIFISNTFREHFGFLADKGEVIYLGREMDATFDITGKSHDAPGSILRLREPYILCVSHILPYKNLGALILGYAQERARLKARGLRLYIVGRALSAREYAKLQRIIERWDLHEWVVLTGPAPEIEVAALFPLAEFVVFQSTCENCPSTLIEALSAGAPIACSNASSMPEIAASAALYFDPFSPSEIGAALVRLAYDVELRADLGARARIRAKYFPSWEKVAADTLKILQAAASNAVAAETKVCVE